MCQIIEVKTYSTSLHEAVQSLVDQLTPTPMIIGEEQLRAVIDHPDSHLYLLQQAERIVGMLTLGIYHSPTGSKAWIEDVVVDDSCRGKGYGKRLVEYAIAEAHSYGVQQLMLTSNPLRIAANALYQQIGFERKETNCYRINPK